MLEVESRRERAKHYHELCLQRNAAENGFWSCRRDRMAALLELTWIYRHRYVQQGVICGCDRLLDEIKEALVPLIVACHRAEPYDKPDTAAWWRHRVKLALKTVALAEYQIEELRGRQVPRSRRARRARGLES
jgi:hypothetical protein